MKRILKLILILTLCCTLLSSCNLIDKIKGGDANDGGNTDGSGDQSNTVPPGDENNGDNSGDQTDTEPPSLADVTFADKTFVYDGNEKSLSVQADTLPAGITVQYTGNGKTNVGDYDVIAKFYFNGAYLEGADKAAKLTIIKAQYDMSGISFTDKTVVYDRNAHSIEIEGTLPEGVTVRYDGNEKTEVGVYTVTAKFVSENENYEPITDMTATLKIEPFSISNLSFSGAEFGYDGTEKSIFITGTVPNDVTVVYDGNGKTEVGAYTVTASFVTDNENYGEFPVLTATLTIVKGTYVPTFPDKSVSFNGDYQSTAVSGTLPEGISVSYVNNAALMPGTYTVTAVFTVDDTKYNAIEDINATLTVVLDGYVTPAADFEYSVKSDGSVQITGYKGIKLGVVIPEKIDGLDVTSIATESFKNNEKITYIYISDSITNIGNSAFADSALECVRFGNNVSNIGASAFKGTKLESVVLPDSLAAIGANAFASVSLKEITIPFVGGSHTTSNGFLGYIFGAKNYAANTSYVPSTLEKVILSEACTKIPAYAFYGCSGLKEVVIGIRVKSIGNTAFGGCTGIRNLYVPSSVESIPANANAYNSPFYGACEELLVVFENNGIADMGQYALFIGDAKSAISIYGKTYQDYLANRDGSYREFDPADSKLLSIFVNGAPVQSFSPDKLDYEVNISILEGIKINATASSFASTYEIIAPTVSNGNTATVKVTSYDGKGVSEYKIKFGFTGSTSAEVVNKNGADATVTFVIDDGHQGTASFAKSMILKYSNLSVTYAVKTSDIATLKTVDSDSDGIDEYVIVNGKYTYEINQTNYDFWKDILSAGRSEIASHTHTHKFWGTNDDGGVFNYIRNASQDVISTSASMPKGSSTKELYAPMQILEELFADYISKNGTSVSLIDAGISVLTKDKTIDGTLVKTYKTFFRELWKKAYDDGELISVRATFGSTYDPNLDLSTKVVTPSKFDSYNERMAGPGYMVEHYNANPEGIVNDDISNWTDYIDAALALGGWAGFCIHDIYETESSSGHNITYAQAEKLFKYAAEKNIWVATYTAAALYYSEWSTASVTSSYEDGSVKVTLTDAERDDVYNEALTIKVSVPATWESAEVGGKTLEVYSNADGSAYVYVNIVPDSGTVTIVGK